MSVKNKLSKPRVGVVLSSGGVRGVYAHTDFLRAWENMAASWGKQLKRAFIHYLEETELDALEEISRKHKSCHE